MRLFLEKKDSYKKFVKSTKPATTAPTITAATIPNSFLPLIGSFCSCMVNHPL